MTNLAIPTHKRNHTILRYPPAHRFRKTLLDKGYSPEFTDHLVRQHHPEGRLEVVA